MNTATYSVQIRKRVRECVGAVYEETGRKFVFEGELLGKKWEQISLAAPKNLPEEDLPRVVANLGVALKKLKYEFVIYRVAASEPIPEDERQAALARLREMGYDPEIIGESSSIRLRQRPNLMKQNVEQARQQGMDMMCLARTALGKRGRIEILAKSDAANATFV